MECFEKTIDKWALRAYNTAHKEKPESKSSIRTETFQQRAADGGIAAGAVR